MPPVTPGSGARLYGSGKGLAIAAAVRRHINVNDGAVTEL